MTIAAIIEGLRAMEARNAELEAENVALRAQVSAAGGDPEAAPVLNKDGLRACPFCGRHDGLRFRGALTKYVVCEHHLTYGPYGMTIEEASTLWNTRR